MRLDNHLRRLEQNKPGSCQNQWERLALQRVLDCPVPPAQLCPDQRANGGTSPADRQRRDREALTWLTNPASAHFVTAHLRTYAPAHCVTGTVCHCALCHQHTVTGTKQSFCALCHVGQLSVASIRRRIYMCAHSVLLLLDVD